MSDLTFGTNINPSVNDSLTLGTGERKWHAYLSQLNGVDIPSNLTFSVMTGATSQNNGQIGLVPAPVAGEQAMFLRGDGTWAEPSSSTATITLSSNNWSNNTQTVSVTGVTVSNNVMVGLSNSATQAQMEATGSAQILCTAQGAGTLTFTYYGDTPSVDIPMTVIIVS